MSRRLNAARGSDGVTREDPDTWTIVRQEPQSIALLARSGPLRPAHNVFVRLYPLSEKRTLIRAWSRSRVGMFDYGRNRRLLAELMTRLERHWAHYGLKARPVAPPDSGPTREQGS